MNDLSSYSELAQLSLVAFFILSSQFLYCKYEKMIESLEHNALVSTPRKKEILEKKEILIWSLTKEEEIKAINKMKMILKSHFDAPSNQNKSYFIMNKSIERSFNTTAEFKYAQFMVDVYEEKGIFDEKYQFALVPSKDALRELSQPNYI